MIHTTQKNYMQDNPEDFISEMTEDFKLFDNVNKSIILLELINWWIKGDANVWIQRKDGKSVIVSLIQRHTVSQLWISQIANQTTTTTNIARIANNKWKWKFFEEKIIFLEKRWLPSLQRDSRVVEDPWVQPHWVWGTSPSLFFYKTIRSDILSVESRWIAEVYVNHIGKVSIYSC